MIYRMSHFETWREHQSELLREAEEAHLARQLIRSRRPKGWSVSALALGFLTALMLAALMLVGASSPAHADTTFTVNLLNDVVDSNGEDGVCDVFASIPGNQCTLSQQPS